MIYEHKYYNCQCQVKLYLQFISKLGIHSLFIIQIRRNTKIHRRRITHFHFIRQTPFFSRIGKALKIIRTQCPSSSYGYNGRKSSQFGVHFAVGFGRQRTFIAQFSVARKRIFHAIRLVIRCIYDRILSVFGGFVKEAQCIRFDPGIDAFEWRVILRFVLNGNVAAHA
eukprot:UN08906